MPNSCAVLGCKNRQSKSLRLYRFPAICKKPKFKELSLIRRNRWLTALQRDDINERNARVCAIHFISGVSAPLKDMYNPDWVPSLHMGNPLYPKRQKYNSSEARKEHAFADLFELIGDGETENDKSSIHKNETTEEENDHNYSRNLIAETSNIKSEEQDSNISEEIDFCDTLTDRFTQSSIKTYDESDQSLNEPTNTDLDIDVVTCSTIDEFNGIHKNNYNKPDRDLNELTNLYTKVENYDTIDQIDTKNYYEVQQISQGITIFDSEVDIEKRYSTNKFNQTIEDNCIELDQQLSQTTLFYSEIDIGSNSNDRINQINDNIYHEQKVNESTIFYSDIDNNQIDEHGQDTQENEYSNKNNLYTEMDNSNSGIPNDNNYLEEIVIFNPEPIIKEIGTQTYMSNNMFEYLVREIAKKNLIIQQKNSIIAEKDKKIGKLKLKLHNIRLEIYNSELNRRKKITSP